jgi:hypothetical protein
VADWNLAPYRKCPCEVVNIEQRCARVMWQRIPCEFLCPGLSCAASSVSACCWRFSEGEIALAGTAEAFLLPGARGKSDRCSRSILRSVTATEVEDQQCSICYIVSSAPDVTART